MTVHRLKLVYDGLDAAENRMPESLSVKTRPLTGDELTQPTHGAKVRC